MKTQKKIIALFLCLLFSISVCGCDQSVHLEAEQKETSSMFVLVEQTSIWNIVYHRDKKVMYAVSRGLYNTGTFTLLVNPDGSPMLWED